MKKIIFLTTLILITSPAYASKIVEEGDTYQYTELVGKFSGLCDASINNYQTTYNSRPTQVQPIAEGTKCTVKVSVYSTRVRTGWDIDGNYVSETLSRKPANLARVNLFAEYEAGQNSCKESSCRVLVKSAKTRPNGTVSVVFPWSNNAFLYHITARRKGTSDTQTFEIRTLESGE